ncbi:MAG: hypothetical protein KDK89_01440 [Alphaproteobacteria bacterium]|nr:hypothetical protein [Alphaproteobacteria bacterium]
MSQTLIMADQLLGALAAAPVRFVHWKSNHHLNEALAGETDLDLLVAAEDADRFRHVVAGLGGLAVISQPWARYPEVEDWLLPDPDSGRFLHLHVHLATVTGLKRIKHLRLPWAGELLAQNRAGARGWPIPSAELELLVLLVRIWAKMPPLKRLFGPRVPAHIMAELRWLESQAKPDALAQAASALGLSARFPLDLATESAIVRQARDFNDQVQQHARMPWSAALLWAAKLTLQLALTKLWYRHVGPIRYRKTLAGKGAMVALIGSDGSGKSTVSQALEKWLRYKIDVHLIYMGSGDGRAGLVNGLRRALSAAFGKKVKARRRRDPDKPVRPAGFAEKLYRLFDLLLLRRKLKLLRLARRLADGGSIILLDRYPQQQFKAISDGPRQQDGRGFAWAARQEQRLFDEAARLGPDLVLKLAIAPEVAHARKPDHDIETIRRKCAITDAIVLDGAATVTIDAAAAPETVLRRTQAEIWDYLRKVSFR